MNRKTVRLPLLSCVMHELELNPPANSIRMEDRNHCKRSAECKATSRFLEIRVGNTLFEAGVTIWGMLGAWSSEPADWSGSRESLKEGLHLAIHLLG